MTTKTRQNGASSFSHLTTVNSDGSVDSFSPVRVSTDWVDTFEGVDNPFWRSQVKAGNNATTPAYGSRSTLEYPVGSAYASYENLPQNIEYIWDGCLDSGFGLPPSPVGFDVQSVDSAARLRFLQNYRSARTSFQGGTFFGELLETLHMLRRPAQALRRGIDEYVRVAKKRSRRASPNTRSKVLAGTWLEYTFGWRPLVNDISDAHKALLASPKRYLLPIKGFAQDTWSDSFQQSSSNAGIQLRVDYAFRYSTSCRILGAVSADFTPPPTELENWGLNASNFIPTVWELIPYSFLVDYFTNIGQVIDGMSLGTVALAWGCKTFRRSAVCSVANVTNVTVGALERHVSCSSGRSSSVFFDRSPVYSVDVGLSDLHFKLPGISTKWLNIGALASLRRA